MTVKVEFNSLETNGCIHKNVLSEMKAIFLYILKTQNIICQIVTFRDGSWWNLLFILDRVRVAVVHVRLHQLVASHFMGIR